MTTEEKNDMLGYLDWGWIEKVCDCLGFDFNEQWNNALKAFEIAEKHDPLYFSESGYFRAIKHPNEEIEILFVVTDISTIDYKSF